MARVVGTIHASTRCTCLRDHRLRVIVPDPDCWAKHGAADADQ